MGRSGSGFDEAGDSTKAPPRFPLIPFAHARRARSHRPYDRADAGSVAGRSGRCTSCRSRARPIGAAVGRLASSLLARAPPGRPHQSRALFPRADGRQRVTLAERHFAALGRSVVERGMPLLVLGRAHRAPGATCAAASTTTPPASRSCCSCRTSLGLDAGATRLRWRASREHLFTAEERLCQPAAPALPHALPADHAALATGRHPRRDPRDAARAAVLLPSGPGLRPARLGVRAVLRRAGGYDHRTRAGGAARRCDRRAGGDADVARRRRLRSAVPSGVGKFPVRGCHRGRPPDERIHRGSRARRCPSSTTGCTSASRRGRPATPKFY